MIDETEDQARERRDDAVADVAGCSYPAGVHFVSWDDAVGLQEAEAIHLHVQLAAARAERDRARAAGRRLSRYWKDQLEGEEILHEALQQHWLVKLSVALGSARKLRLDGILAKIHGLRNEDTDG